MKFFQGFYPLTPRSPINDAMTAKNAFRDDKRKMLVYEAVIRLPDEERALMVDIMRQLPFLSAANTDRGVGPRNRLERFIKIPHRVGELDDLMRRNLFSDDEIAQIGSACYIPEMDGETVRHEAPWVTKEG